MKILGLEFTKYTISKFVQSIMSFTIVNNSITTEYNLGFNLTKTFGYTLEKKMSLKTVHVLNKTILPIHRNRQMQN